MPDTTTTTNMNLVLPVVGVRTGPDWANDLNAALSLVDSHDHSSGKGVLITPSGLNINADLTFNNNNATSLGRAGLTNQSATFSSSVLTSIYVVSGNLYYNNGSGASVQITNGSSVSGASGTITGLTGSATAAFSTPDFNFYFDSNKFGKANFSEYKLYEHNQASPTKSITLKAAAGFESGGTSYSLTFPSTISSGYLASNGSGTLSIASSNTIIDGYTRSTGTTVGVRGVGISNDCGNFTTASTSYVSVTNLSVTITTSGRPVMLMLQPSGSSESYIYSKSSSGTSANSYLRFLRDGATQVSEHIFGHSLLTTSGIVLFPSSGFYTIDVVGAGTYTYTVQVKALTVGITDITLYFARLIAYEL